MAHTEFSAKFDGLNMASKNKLTLILPENTTDATLGKLVRMKGQQVHVTFEDPQQEMDMDEERPERKVMTFTADQNGVVQLEKQLNFDDASPTDGEGGQTEVKTEGDSALDSTNQVGPTDGAAGENASKDIVITVRTNPDEGQVEDGEEDGNLIEYVFPIADGKGLLPTRFVNGEDQGIVTGEDIAAELGIELTEEGFFEVAVLTSAGGVLRDKQSSGEDELSWEDNDKGEQDESEPEDTEQTGEEEGATSADPVDLETYILTARPSFDDIPYDFPTLLERRNAGETWKAISESIGVGNKELGNVWRRYKDKAAAQQAAGE